MTHTSRYVVNPHLSPRVSRTVRRRMWLLAARTRVFEGVPPFLMFLAVPATIAAAGVVATHTDIWVPTIYLVSLGTLALYVVVAFLFSLSTGPRNWDPKDGMSARIPAQIHPDTWTAIIGQHLTGKAAHLELWSLILAADHLDEAQRTASGTTDTDALATDVAERAEALRVKLGLPHFRSRS